MRGDLCACRTSALSISRIAVGFECDVFGVAAELLLRYTSLRLTVSTIATLVGNSRSSYGKSNRILCSAEVLLADEVCRREQGKNHRIPFME